MSTKTSIEWTDATWNPVRGCSRVSEGCRHCYAERQASRFSGPGRPFDGFVRIQTGVGPQWTGKVELVEKHLLDPLSWREPKRVFVNSMSDLFHENLPDEAIDRVFAVMASCRQHAFQILTKRPERMLAYLNTPMRGARVDTADPAKMGGVYVNPLPNVWLGVSVENQETANARIPPLLQTPAARRFASYEPALGPVDFDSFVVALFSQYSLPGWPRSPRKPLMQSEEWLSTRIIVGGESGPGARPFSVDWARNTIEQCKAAGVACFVKQLGAKPIDSAQDLSPWPNGAQGEPGAWRPVLFDKKGGDWAEWPPELRVREFPGVLR